MRILAWAEQAQHVGHRFTVAYWHTACLGWGSNPQ